MLKSLIWFIVFICIIWLVIINCNKICGWLSNLKIGKNSVPQSDGAYDGTYDGAYDGAYGEGSPSRVAMDTYEHILPYTVEVGSSSHIEQYLTGLLGKQTVSDWVRSQGVQKPALLELLITGAVRTQAQTVHELTTLLDLRYLWFIPSNKHAVMLNSHKYDLGLRSELRAKIRKDASTLNETEIDKLTDKLLVVAKSYYKLKSNYVKKPVSAINKAKDDAFELDYIGIETPIKYLIGCVKFTQDAPKSIDEKLREIDLMRMYPKDPYAVRLFIDRIRRDIKNIEGLPSNQRFGVNSLLSNIERENNILNWGNHIKQAERDQLNLRRNQLNLQRERENLQREREQAQREQAQREQREQIEQAKAESIVTAQEEKEKREAQSQAQVSQLTGQEFKKDDPFYIPEFKKGERRLSSPI